tara:strand:- start:741 stop:1385 length:645 start_codon:yes stop_codon:yes gene_type:complete
MELSKKENQIIKRKMAIELCATIPEITNKELAAKLGISYKKACTWRNDPKFIEKSVDRFIEMVGKEVPLVMKALIREAKEGNTRAAEIFLKQVGRLQETLTVKIEAPFMQHLKSKEGSLEPDDLTEVAHVVEFEDLPDRDPINNKPVKRIREDFKNTRTAIKKAKKNANRNERYNLRKRAEKVGMDPLPPGRPHPAKRKTWLKKLESLEKKAIK